MKPSQKIKQWVAGMQRQGVDITALTISQYKWHLVLLGGTR